jgi:flagellar hook-length control protein FliK
MPDGVLLAEMFRPLTAPRTPQPAPPNSNDLRNDDGQDAFQGALEDAVANRPQPQQKSSKPAATPKGEPPSDSAQAPSPEPEDNAQPPVSSDEAAALAAVQPQVAPIPVVAPVVPVTEPVFEAPQVEVVTSENLPVKAPVAKLPAERPADLFPPPASEKSGDAEAPVVQPIAPPPEASDDQTPLADADSLKVEGAVPTRNQRTHITERFAPADAAPMPLPTDPSVSDAAKHAPVAQQPVEKVQRAIVPEKLEPIDSEPEPSVATGQPAPTVDTLPPRSQGRDSLSDRRRSLTASSHDDKKFGGERATGATHSSNTKNLNWVELDSPVPTIRTGSGDALAAGIARFLIESDAGTDRAAASNSPAPDALSSGSSVTHKATDFSRTPSSTGTPTIDAKSGVSQFLVSQTRVAETIDQAARVLAGGGNGRYQVTMHLDPPDLGKLRLDVQMIDQMMTLRVDADSRQVASLIESKLSNLRDSLALHGIRVDRTEITVRPGAEGSSTSSQDNSQNQSSNRESQTGSSNDSSNWTGSQFTREGRERESWGQGEFGSNFDDDSFAPGSDSASEHLAPVGARAGDTLVDVLV